MRATSTPVLWLLAALPFAFGACVDVDFGDGGGGGTSATTTSAGGSAGVGGSATSTSVTTTTSSSSSGAGGGDAGGSPPCVPTAETCNGIDDDCDGRTDQPPNQVEGNFCGCDWTFDAAMGGRAYALCPTAGQSFDTVTCPGGTRKVVLQTGVEHSFVASWLMTVLAATEAAYVGLAQKNPGSSVGSGWAWLTGPSDSAGMVPQWNTGQPNDQNALEPVAIESGDQDCGAFYRIGTTLPALHDQGCDGAEYVVCEDASPQACVAGGPCLLAAGCAGVFDCAQPAGSECVAAPKTETCNGMDDDCDGQVDASIGSGHACDCVASTNPATSRDYKLCAQLTHLNEAECGPGFRLTVIGDAAEQAYITGLVGAGDYHIGLYQRTDAATVAAGWLWVDGTALGASFWDASQPTDGTDMTENDEENCGQTTDTGWYDRPCGNNRPYVCEEI